MRNEKLLCTLKRFSKHKNYAFNVKLQRSTVISIVKQVHFWFNIALKFSTRNGSNNNMVAL